MRTQYILTILVLISLGVGCSDDNAQPAPKTNNGTMCPEGQQRNPISQKCVSINKDMSQDIAVDLAGDMNNADQSTADMPPKKDMTVADMIADMVDPPDMTDMMVDMPPVMEVRRFVAIGDTGTGSDMQIKVGQSIGKACLDLGGCDFGMLLGDNAYDSGFDDENDPKFVDFFERPYGHLGFPFYAVLGNHDLGGNGLGVSLDLKKGDYQVLYGQRNPQWKMPAKYYQVQEGPVWMVGLNTTDIFFDRDRDQRRDVQGWLNSAPQRGWKIAFGHHPYISNGPHGNAGRYEGLPFVPIANGEHVQSFMEDIVCAQFDIYLCGHDHNVQDLKKICGTEFIVSGAGAKTTDLEGTNPVHYESDEPGFVILEATERKMILRFYDQDAVLKHTRTLVR